NPVTCTVDTPLAISREKDYSFLKGFTRDGAGVNANSTDHFTLINHCDPFLNFSGLHSGFLAGWPTADDEQVVIEPLIGLFLFRMLFYHRSTTSSYAYLCY